MVRKMHPDFIDTHFARLYFMLAQVGNYKIPVNSLSDCEEKWLDRPLDEMYVDRLVKVLEEDNTAMSNMQPWLAIANISKADFTSSDLILGCYLQVIGGRHRKQAYKQLLTDTTDPSRKRLFAKVWVSVYDNTMSDEQVRKLAAQHNSQNVGSRETKWVERVQTCREWLFRLAGKNAEDDTPNVSTEWKQSCQRMYTPQGKWAVEPGNNPLLLRRVQQVILMYPVKQDVNSLEPTLQAALLKKDAWRAFLKVAHMYGKGELKGMTDGKKKRCRRKKEREIKQHQLGMPLQGLAEDSKIKLLSAVLNKELSIEEMAQSSKHIKAKKNIAMAFIKYVQEDSLEALQKRFPLHATEEKLNQFKHLRLRKGVLPLELETFFKGALAWEADDVNSGANTKLEKKGLYSFHVKNFEEVGLLLEGSATNFPEPLIQKLNKCPGFNLVLLKLDEDCDPNILKLFLIKLHSLNLGKIPVYCIVLFVETAEQLDWSVGVMKDKMTYFQKAYWVDTRPKPPKGNAIVGCISTGRNCVAMVKGNNLRDNAVYLNKVVHSTNTDADTDGALNEDNELSDDNVDSEPNEEEVDDETMSRLDL
ncbi:hypothetical protein QZH41_020314 [Actinostola sp. cb2023]|nr:hypothetical protein QZH41_020314 [Actinostola sp. cb2023]